MSEFHYHSKMEFWVMWVHCFGMRNKRVKRGGFVETSILVKVFQDGMLTALLMDTWKEHKSFSKCKNMKGWNYFWRYWSLEVYFIRNSFTKCLYGKSLHRSHMLKRLPNISKIYSLMVVVARCPKSRAMLPPEALEENFPLSLPTLGGYWHSLGYGHISLSALSSHYLLVCVLNLPMALL